MKFFFYRGRFRRSYGDEELVIDEPASPRNHPRKRLLAVRSSLASSCDENWRGKAETSITTVWPVARFCAFDDAKTKSDDTRTLSFGNSF